MSRGSVSHSYEYVPDYFTATRKIVSERFILKIRQQPVQTRLSTNKERDRRPLDPPPIVQIELDNSNTQETQDFLQNPYLFMCVSLVYSTTHEDVTHATQNTLAGQTSSSMYKLKDINNHDGGFFVFGDLSVKLEGQFRLKFSMFEISTHGATSLKSIYSNVFQVHPSKTFPGMLESTFLSRSFSDQGVRIRIRKEHRVQMTGTRKRKLSSQEDALDLSDERSNHPDNHHPNHQPHQSSLLSPYSNASIYTPQRPSSMDYDHQQHLQQNKNGNINNHRSSYHNLQHTDPRQGVPYSPPHQSYDHHRPNNSHGIEQAYHDFRPYPYPHPHLHHQHQRGYPNYHRDNMIPSPPPQASLFKSDSSPRLSLDDALPLPRQPADQQRRLSLQQCYASMTHQPFPQQQSSAILSHTNATLNKEIIHLPPLRSIVINNGVSQQPQQEGIVEVDAAVTMMQLASRRQQQQDEGR